MKLGSEFLGNQGKKGSRLDYTLPTTWERKVAHFFPREANCSLVLHSNRQLLPKALLRDLSSVMDKASHGTFIAGTALVFMWLFLISALNKSQEHTESSDSTKVILQEDNRMWSSQVGGFLGS